MASNENLCCTSSNGKTILVDPNNFSIHDSSSNQPVQLEDLTIYVQLETSKKARTAINSENGSINIETTKDVKVRFIDGEIVNGNKVLTTNFTDLTTTFDKVNQTETLGITSIDIDFNSSYAPLITINFVDVRGSAIFQNESNINNNKYSIFFDLPYPLFTLTIKGYYGMPVKYDLHMTKFNAKFNSNTGNFEIVANFIGYTYAMLSDMLLGYLRAIPYTKKGAEYYSKTNVLTLDGLVQKISELDGEISKIPDSNEVKELNSVVDKKTTLESIRLQLKTLGSSLSLNTELENYRYIITNHVDEVNNVNNNAYVNTKNNNTNSSFNSYDEAITELVDQFNKDAVANITLDINFLLSKSLIKKSNLDIKNLEFYATAPGGYFTNNVSELKKYIEDNGLSSNSSQSIDAYNLTSQYDLIDQTIKALDNAGNLLKLNVAEEIRIKIEKKAGFKPTIRNVIDVFTTAVDVFMKVLFDVSNEAKNDETRKKELEKIFDNNKKNLNYKNNTTFYPWPEYRRENTNGLLEENYLGDESRIVPSNVTELRFIDELLMAFLISEQKIRDIEKNEEKSSQTWIPSNPLDSNFYNGKFPYDRINGNKAEDVISDLMVRAFTYIGFSNYKLSEEEIVNFCNSECTAILRDIKNKSILNEITQKKEDYYYSVKGKNNLIETPIMGEIGDDYVYSFIVNGSPKKVLPITIPGKGDFSFYFVDTQKNVEELDKINYNYLTNFTTSAPNVNKPYDGGVYVNIIDSSSYYQYKKTVPNSSELKSLIFESLQKPQTEFNELSADKIGYSQFGGLYGIQEYKTVNFGLDKLENAEYRLLFIKDNAKNNIIGGNSITRVLNQYNSDFETGSETFKSFGLNEVTIKHTTGESVKGNLLFNNRLNLSSHINNEAAAITYPFINFQVIPKNGEAVPVGLFASALYYGQNLSGYYEDYNKAFLFLHTLPWNGLNYYQGIFFQNEIINTFGNRAGFISAPKLWAAFIGGLLWRSDSSKPNFYTGTQIIESGGSDVNDPIKWTDGKNYFIPTYTSDNKYPSKNEYLLSEGIGNFEMVFNETSNSYKNLDPTLLQLPNQAKEEFKKAFFNFVKKQDGSKSDWDYLKSQLEVYNGDITNWYKISNEIAMVEEPNGGKVVNSDYIRTSFVRNKLNLKNNDKFVFNSYRIFNPYTYRFKGNYATQLKDDSEGVKTILRLLSEEVYIMNSTYRIWQKNSADNSSLVAPRSDIKVKKSDLSKFVKQAIVNFNPEVVIKNNNDVDKQAKQNIFGSENDRIIKLQMYKTCENIYNKWVGGNSAYENIFGNRSYIDSELAKKNNTDLTLIDSFRFIDRSFKDIGDELYINPTPVSSFLKNNIDYSFYNAVTSLLASNNLDFIALPSYINYRDASELSKMFQPMPTADFFKDGIVGPSFICMYVGQTSKYLDFNSSAYPNDGVDFRCDGTAIKPTNASDFEISVKPYENNVPVFAVNYSQQNQNIFKDIILDQSEFSSTDESLRIVDDIANRGSENRPTFGGQNMYNIYSTRSYKAEVEMLGNAMVQPMMYFQLNNIPMFHGAYLITHVKHRLQPNNMSTNFTGVRIRNIGTPLIDSYQMYMSLLDSLGIEGFNTTFGGNTDVMLKAKKDAESVKCNQIQKGKTYTFSEILNVIIDNLEGSYYSPKDISKMSEKDRQLFSDSRETLWGVDRGQSNSSTREKKFWEAIDKENKSKWNYKYPKPANNPALFDLYLNIIENKYKSNLKEFGKNEALNKIIESDSRLYFNMIYAAINGSGWFKGFYKILELNFNSGNSSPDVLLSAIVTERLIGGSHAYELGTGSKLGNDYILIMKTGYKIEKIVGLSKNCA